MNGGVTYRRTSAPSFNSKDGLSKEIKIHENEQQEHQFFGWKRLWSGKRKEVVGGRSGEGPGGTHTMSRRATLSAAPAGGVGAWWVPLVLTRYSHVPREKIGPMV